MNRSPRLNSLLASYSRRLRLQSPAGEKRPPRGSSSVHVLVLGVLLTLLPACRVHSASSPPQISGSGLVRGHIALGLRDEDQFLRFRASLSPDSLVEFSLWKLFRFDIGLVGASVGVGPIDVGLGTLFYDPYIPQMIEWGEGADGTECCEEPEVREHPGDDDQVEDHPGDRDDDGKTDEPSWRDTQEASVRVMGSL